MLKWGLPGSDCGELRCASSQGVGEGQGGMLGGGGPKGRRAEAGGHPSRVPHTCTTCASQVVHIYLTRASHVPHMCTTCTSHVHHMYLTRASSSPPDWFTWLYLIEGIGDAVCIRCNMCCVLCTHHMLWMQVSTHPPPHLLSPNARRAHAPTPLRGTLPIAAPRAWLSIAVMLSW